MVEYFCPGSVYLYISNIIHLSSKKDDSSLCHDVIITHQRLMISEFVDYNSKIDIFRDMICH